jgi:hypothetical protein
MAKSIDFICETTWRGQLGLKPTFLEGAMAGSSGLVPHDFLEHIAGAADWFCDEVGVIGVFIWRDAKSGDIEEKRKQSFHFAWLEPIRRTLNAIAFGDPKWTFQPASSLPPLPSDALLPERDLKNSIEKAHEIVLGEIADRRKTDPGFAPPPAFLSPDLFPLVLAWIRQGYWAAERAYGAIGGDRLKQVEEAISAAAAGYLETAKLGDRVRITVTDDWSVVLEPTDTERTEAAP